MEASNPSGLPRIEDVRTITLDFSCCGCADAIQVTLRCEGRGLAGTAAHTVASIPISCPMCGQDNELFFEPRGRVRDVRPWSGCRAFPTPSRN